MGACVKKKNVFAIFTIMTAPVTIAQTALMTVSVSYAEPIDNTESPLTEPLTLMEVFEQYPELMGERTTIDPFDDDEVIECDLENPEICDSCQ